MPEPPRTTQPPADPYVYEFAWGNNERRAELKGRRCRKIARGSKGTVLVEMLDTGERVTCSFRALRRAAS